ncbi:hypothetical protein Ancab_011493 [Ancistrocladus abbreviatus]
MAVVTTNSSSGDWCTTFAIRVSMFVMRIKVDKDAFNVCIVKEVPIPDYVLPTNTSSQSGMLSPANYPSALMKLVQDNSTSMANPRMEDDLSHLLIEKDGSVAGKMTKSLTLVEELTNAGGKVLLHVSRCSGCDHFSTNIEAVQSRFFADPPSPTALQSMLGLSALLD